MVTIIIRPTNFLTNLKFNSQNLICIWNIVCVRLIERYPFAKVDDLNKKYKVNMNKNALLAFLNQAYACFLEIAFVHNISMHVCLCVCLFVCLSVYLSESTPKSINNQWQDSYGVIYM